MTFEGPDPSEFTADDPELVMIPGSEALHDERAAFAAHDPNGPVRTRHEELLERWSEAEQNSMESTDRERSDQLREGIIAMLEIGYLKEIQRALEDHPDDDPLAVITKATETLHLIIDNSNIGAEWKNVERGLVDQAKETFEQEYGSAL